MDAEEGRRRADRLLAAAEAFEGLTIDCYRCGRDVTLANLMPTARGFLCRRCAIEMPRREHDALVAEGMALADELAPGD